MMITVEMTEVTDEILCHWITNPSSYHIITYLAWHSAELLQLSLIVLHIKSVWCAHTHTHQYVPMTLWALSTVSSERVSHFNLTHIQLYERTMSYIITAVTITLYGLIISGYSSLPSSTVGWSVRFVMKEMNVTMSGRALLAMKSILITVTIKIVRKQSRYCSSPTAHDQT